jgi:hypothetical protein
MNNHLIIGLGGTGGKIIRSLRKTIFQDFRSNKPDDINIGYLYLDTSDEMMSIDDPSWRVLGESVQLDEGSKVFIKPGGLMEVIKNIKQYPGIKDWIGNETDWIEYLNSTSGLITAGGQRRRLGRFILACNASLFERSLKTQINQLQNVSGTADVTFHVCCGLAGGTGSGTIIDVLSQIRKNFRPSGITSFRIILYLFLPEEHPKDNRDSGFYHANGYAALLELNAFNVGSFIPIDISTTITNGKTRFTNIDDPFNGAYLFSNINENGNKVDVDNELPNIISDFLYQKLISIKDVEWKRDRLGKQENHENLDTAPERSSTSSTPERSIRFLGFGVKRIAIPEEEIREYITYTYASQALLQLRYNNWADETGFRNEAVNQNFGELINNKDTQNRWLITDEHFKLSSPIINDQITKRWKSIGDTWRMVIPEFKSQAKDKKDSNWLDELKKLCQKYFSENYRNLGVLKFYEAKVNDKKDLAREIVSRIEKELFDEWKNAVKSLFDIKRLLDTLIENLSERFQKIDEDIVRKQQLEDTVLATILENEKTWAKVGMLSAMVGKKDRLLDAQGVAFEELNIYKTQISGLQFSKVLLSEVIEQLNGVKSEIDKSNQTLDAALKEFEKNVNERCNDNEGRMNEEEYYKQQVIRFYNPEKVKNITKRFIRDKKEQGTQTSNVRKSIVTRLGDQPNFSVFNERISKGTLINTLESVCSQNTKNAEASLEVKDRLFDVGIVGKLKERYDGNYEELRRYIKRLVDYSGCFITFDQNEINKSGDGTKNPPTKIKTFTVVIPKASEHQDFLNNLERAFRETAPAGITPDFVYTTVKKNEIVLLSLINGFPLRYLSLVNVLQNKYKERVNKEDGAKAKMFLHLEGNGEDLPRLFIPTQKEMDFELNNVRNKSIKYILLADAMGYIKEKQDDNGYTKLAFVKPDQFGDLVPIFFMEQKLSDCYLNIDRRKFEILENFILPLFESDYKHKQQKENLQTSIIGLVNNIKAERSEDNIYNLHKAEASNILEKLKSF